MILIVVSELIQELQDALCSEPGTIGFTEETVSGVLPLSESGQDGTMGEAW